MKINKLHLLSLLIPAAIALGSCSDDDDNNSINNAQLQTDILANVAKNVCEASYVDMYNKAVALQTAITTLNTTTNDENLAAAQAAWQEIRVTWERSEAWLFGPVEADNIDPRIDTWPVDFNDLNGILNSDQPLTEEYINSLEDGQKGFHPIEYLLWGQNGNKTASALTSREKEYLSALVSNLVDLAQDAKDTWQGGYTQQLANAGSGNQEFPSQQAAFLQLVDGMAGICDEVANSKIKEPFESGDASQEESPFAQNSFTDFTNNIRGILLMYQGQFSADGKGLEDLVQQYNGTLDGQIKSAHAAAISALESFGDVPFGTAIKTRESDIKNAMEKINTLADLLNNDLTRFVQQFVK
ncbi:Uncharacterized iron-regulated protein [bacterium A37T11]|nr:Uncharacterized iron-regulated protein [bacterium A37T11]